MENYPLWFSVIPHKDGALSYHLELGPFSANFGLISVSGLLLKDDEIGHPRELVDIFELGIVDFSRIVFQIQDDSPYPPNEIALQITPQI